MGKWMHATVTVCHSKTTDLPSVCLTADILVVAIPDPTKKSGQRLVGDVDYKEVTISILSITVRNVQVFEVASKIQLQIQIQIHPQILHHTEKFTGSGSSQPFDSCAWRCRSYDCCHAYVQHSAGSHPFARGKITAASGQWATPATLR